MRLKANNNGYLKEDDTNATPIGEKYEGLSINRIKTTNVEHIYIGDQTLVNIPVKYKSIKVKGILRITRDLTLIRDNNQVHMVLFLDKNTPENYIYLIPFQNNKKLDDDYNIKLIDGEKKIYKAFSSYIIKQTSKTDGIQPATTWYIQSPFENDKNNQKLLKSLLSEKEYTSFMSNRFACTYVAVECDLSNFQITSYAPYSDTISINEGYYTNKFDIGIDISTKAEYFTNPQFYHDDYSHAKISNYKVIDKHSVSIYITKWFHEDYFYSSYAKNGVIALPCSDDEYINVREKPTNDSKVKLQIVNILPRSLLLIYPPNEKWATKYFYFDTKLGKDTNSNNDSMANLGPNDIIDYKLQKYDKYLELKINSKDKINKKYKIYPIFIHDVLKDDWCKVTIYKSNYMPVISSFKDLNHAGTIADIHNLYKKIVYSHDEVYLMDGYIHASQLHPISVIRVKDTI